MVAAPGPVSACPAPAHRAAQTRVLRADRPLVVRTAARLGRDTAWPGNPGEAGLLQRPDHSPPLGPATFLPPSPAPASMERANVSGVVAKNRNEPMTNDR